MYFLVRQLIKLSETHLKVGGVKVGKDEVDSQPLEHQWGSQGGEGRKTCTLSPGATRHKHHHHNTHNIEHNLRENLQWGNITFLPYIWMTLGFFSVFVYYLTNAILCCVTSGSMLSATRQGEDKNKNSQNRTTRTPPWRGSEAEPLCQTRPQSDLAALLSTPCLWVDGKVWVLR